MNVLELLLKNVEKTPDKPTFVFKDQPLSFQELKETVFKLANGLDKLGVKPQDRIGIYLPNWLEYAYSYLALFCLGATAVPLDYMLTEAEMASCLGHCEAKFIIAKAKDVEVFKQLKSDVPTLKDVILLDSPEKDFINFSDLINSSTTDFKERKIREDDLSIILYTSGTTGRPKGIMLTYKHLEAPCLATGHVINFTPKDIIAAAVPFSHIAGLMYPLLSLYFNMTIILLERFIPLRFLQAVEKYKVTFFYLVPSMYYAILHLKEFEVFDLSSIRCVTVFGAPSNPEILRRFHQYCPHAHFINGWGLTETCGPSVVLPLGSERLESVGLPVPWNEIKIVDDGGRELPKGQIGEVIFKSWTVMKGYFKDEEETRRAIRDGWLYTGDLGRIDEEGYLYIVGRKKEMIKVSGELVYATEVETVIGKHPQVKEIAVIGVPDQLRGEAVKVILSLKQGAQLSEEDIRYFAKEYLAHFKVPSIVEFMEVLPKTTSGKVDKAKLSELSGKN
ncbi:MAG: class I adenylate-forming enzyme family protein [Candidatus Omnitrophota bacterium]